MNVAALQAERDGLRSSLAAMHAERDSCAAEAAALGSRVAEMRTAATAQAALIAAMDAECAASASAGWSLPLELAARRFRPPPPPLIAGEARVTALKRREAELEAENRRLRSEAELASGSSAETGAMCATLQVRLG